MMELQIGEVINVQLIDPPTKLSELIRGVWLPVRILQEYEKFFLCEVLPHHNPILSWGLSKPYKLCLNKMAIKLNEIKIKGMTN